MAELLKVLSQWKQQPQSTDPAPASAPAVAAPAQAIDLQQLGEQLNRLEQKVDRLTALLLKQQQD
ncbi:hypothetical protein D3C85_434740 [compost metagenome]